MKTRRSFLLSLAISGVLLGGCGDGPASIAKDLGPSHKDAAAGPDRTAVDQGGLDVRSDIVVAVDTARDAVVLPDAGVDAAPLVDAGADGNPDLNDSVDLGGADATPLIVTLRGLAQPLAPSVGDVDVDPAGTI